MKHIITIDDRSKIGRNLLELLRTLSKTNKAVDFLSPQALEELESDRRADTALLKLMEEGRQSGYASREEVMKTLRSITEE